MIIIIFFSIPIHWLIFYLLYHSSSSIIILMILSSSKISLILPIFFIFDIYYLEIFWRNYQGYHFNKISQIFLKIDIYQIYQLYPCWKRYSNRNISRWWYIGLLSKSEIIFIIEDERYDGHINSDNRAPSYSNIYLIFYNLNNIWYSLMEGFVLGWRLYIRS